MTSPLLQVFLLERTVSTPILYLGLGLRSENLYERFLYGRSETLPESIGV